MALSHKRKAFVNAYLGDAHGNATQAAIMAGYSPRSAKTEGSRLLTHADIQEALGRRIDKAQMSADESLERVALIARAEAKDPRAVDVLKANELILKVHGKLQDKRDDSSSRVTVNIGFLSPGHAELPAITVSAGRVE